MSRDEARRTVSEAALAREMDGIWFDTNDAASLCEEAPSAYKDVRRYSGRKRELTRLVRRVRPLLCYKG